MSTILKALRRLEQERTQADRPLREQVTGIGAAADPETGAARRWPILLGGIGAGVVAGAAVLFLVLSRGESPPTPPAAEPAAAVAEAAPQPPAPRQRVRRRARPAPSAPAPAAAPAERSVVVDADDVEVIDRGAPAPRIAAESAEVAAPVAPADPEPGSVRPFRPAQRGAIPQAAPHPEAAPAPAPIAPPAPVEEAAPPAPPVAKSVVAAVEPAKRAAARAPSAPAAPPSEPFPALRVERTTWHPLAERRLAVVDVPGEGARELREGDVAAGATVSRIEPSGVVFRHAGRDVRRKIGAQ